MLLLRSSHSTAILRMYEDDERYCKGKQYMYHRTVDELDYNETCSGRLALRATTCKYATQRSPSAASSSAADVCNVLANSIFVYTGRYTSIGEAL